MIPTSHDVTYMACELAALADAGCADILPLIWQARDAGDEVALTARIIAMENAVIAGRIARAARLNAIDRLDEERRVLVAWLRANRGHADWMKQLGRLDAVEAALERLYAELAVA